MLEQLRRQLSAFEKPASIEGAAGFSPFGIEATDSLLGGGLARGALHEIAAPGEAHLPAATGFVLGLAALRNESSLPPHPTSLRSVDLSPQGWSERTKTIVWIAEDLALAESGAPHGPGLDAFGLAPERLLTVAVPRPRDLLWAMEEALRCRAVHAAIGEWRHGALDMVAVRRLSLAAAESGALALLLRSAPARDASTAATRWIVGPAPSVIPGRRNDEDIKPRFAAHLVRNRRGPLGSWTLEWNETDERFILATHAQPMAAPAFHRPHRQVA